MLNDNMKRRLFVAFAVLFPIAIFGAAKWAARWRPIAIGNLVGVKKPIDWDQWQVFDVSNRYVITGDYQNRVLFDLQTGQLRSSEAEGITQGGTALWKAVEKNPRQIIIENDNARRIYTMPWPQVSWMNHYSTTLPSVISGPQATNVFVKYSLIRWNSNAPQTPKTVNFQIDLVLGSYALTRDGEKIIKGGLYEITELSTRTGKVVKYITLDPKPTIAAFPRLSPFGTYALYAEAIPNSSERCRIVDASTGQALWRFASTQSEMYLSVLSCDEKIIAVPLFSRKIWQIRDLKKGRLIGTVPLVSGTVAGAFSPDNSTLYSVANDVLYRQRAR